MTSQIPPMQRFHGLQLTPSNNPFEASLQMQYTDVSGELREFSMPLVESLALLNLLRGVEKDQRLENLTRYSALQHNLEPMPPDEPVPVGTLPTESLRPLRTTNHDPMMARYYQRALNNELAVAVGSASSPKTLSIPALGAQIRHEFALPFSPEHAYSYFERWDQFVDEAVEKVGRDRLNKWTLDLLAQNGPTQLQRQIAALPVSNFIDATIDRGLTKALIDLGKKPVPHDAMSGMMGSWRQTDPDEPHVFYVLEQPSPAGGWASTLTMKTFIAKPQNPINRENIREMLQRKDLLLAGFSSFEAEFILHLPFFTTAGGKILNTGGNNDPAYWARNGVYLSDVPLEEFVGSLLPRDGTGYGVLDALGPAGKVIDMWRKESDAFISYSREDMQFADWLAASLRMRELRPWHDVRAMEVGAVIGPEIEKSLKSTYACIIVLTPAAVRSEWVNKEIDMALKLEQEKALTILPVLLQDCDVPHSLRGRDFGDFRDQGRREGSLTRLVKAIRDIRDRIDGKHRG